MRISTLVTFLTLFLYIPMVNTEAQSVGGLGKSSGLVNAAPYDTIWVPMAPREVKITIDKGIDTPNEASIGGPGFGAKLLGCCVVILKAGRMDAAPASLFILHGEKIYNGVIGYKENLAKEDETIDWRSKKASPEAEGTNKEGEVKVDTETPKNIGMLLGKKKDKFKTVGVVSDKEKITFQLSDIMHDESKLYIKFVMENNSKVDYEINFIDFLFVSTADSREYRQVQESEKVSNNVSIVSGKERKVIVYAIPRFTITSKWELRTTVREKNGGRKLELVIPYDVLNSATQFN